MPEKRLTIKKRLLLLFMVFVIVLNTMPVSVFAHNAYFIKVTYDKGAKKVVGQVVYDDVGAGRIRKMLNKPSTILNPEKSHQEYRVVEDSGNKSGSVGNIDDLKLTFPGKEIKKDDKGVANNGGSMDAARAMEIANTLVAELNDYIYTTHPEGFETFEDFKSAVNEAKSAGSATTGGEYTTVNTKDGGQRKFLTSMVKGYGTETLETGAKSPIYDTEYSGSNDVINWSDLIDIADAHEAIGVYYADAGLDKKPGAIEEKLSKFFGSVLLGLQSMLGLYSTNDLVFNQGSRAVGFYGGIMSMDWMNKVVGFHIIFLSIAFSVLVLAIAKLLFQRNLATISTYARISLIEGIKDLIVVMILLGLIFPIISMVIRVNANIVEIMAGTAPAYSVLGTTGAGGDFNNFAGIIVMFFYFFISIYLNVVFIIRAITIAFLIATAPIFVMAIAFGNSGKSMFISWARELVANIFLQAFFAFIISFFMNIQTSTRVLENLIISFSLIPLSGVFRGLIMGQAGGATTQIAHRAASQGTKAAGALALAGGALAVAGGGAAAKAVAGNGSVSEIAGKGSMPAAKSLGMNNSIGGKNQGGNLDLGCAPASGPEGSGGPSGGSTGGEEKTITSMADDVYRDVKGPENDNYERLMKEENKAKGVSSSSSPSMQARVQADSSGQASNSGTSSGEKNSNVSAAMGGAMAGATLVGGIKAGKAETIKPQFDKEVAPPPGMDEANFNMKTESDNFNNLQQEEIKRDGRNDVIDSNQAGKKESINQEHASKMSSIGTENASRTRTAEEEARAKEKLSDRERANYGADTNPNWRDNRRQAIMGSAFVVGSKKLIDKGVSKAKPVITNSPVYQSAAKGAQKVMGSAKATVNTGKNYVAGKSQEFQASHPQAVQNIRKVQEVDRKVYAKATSTANAMGDKVAQPVKNIASTTHQTIKKDGGYIKQAPRAIGRTVAGVTAASAALAYGGEDSGYANKAMAAASEKLTPRRLQQFQHENSPTYTKKEENNNNSAKYYEASRPLKNGDYQEVSQNQNNYDNRYDKDKAQSRRQAEAQKTREERDLEDYQASRG